MGIDKRKMKRKIKTEQTLHKHIVCKSFCDDDFLPWCIAWTLKHNVDLKVYYLFIPSASDTQSNTKIVQGQFSYT